MIGASTWYPGLAESYYVNTTCGCYVFKLRTNATWQDGQPVTAEDVKFTFEKIVPFYTNFGTLYFPNTTVTIVNSTTVIIKPGVFLPGAQLQLFAAPDTTPILPKHILDGQDFLKSSFLTNPIGSGPYKLSSWVKGSYIELVRNDNYWDDSKPYLSKIIIKFISDPAKQTEYLQKVEMEINKDLPEIVLYRVPWVNVFSTNFAGSDIPIRGQWYFASTMLDVYYLPIQTTSSTTTPQQSTTTPANTTSGSSVGTPSGSIIWVIVGILILALITLAITVRRKK